MTLLTIWLHALDCYVEWAYGVMDLNAAFDECVAAVSQSEGLWDCIHAYGNEWVVLASDFFGCFN